jgi:hypothetical protein
MESREQGEREQGSGTSRASEHSFVHQLDTSRDENNTTHGSELLWQGTTFLL